MILHIYLIDVFLIIINWLIEFIKGGETTTVNF